MVQIAERLNGVRIGPETSSRNVVVFPLMGPGPAEPGYLTLDEALARELVKIEEVSEGGSVPTLHVLNHGPVPVLLLDGEELVGAKQNRVVNLTILVPPASMLPIPVSCVEAGRWSFRTAAFESAPRTLFAEGRARKMAQVSRSLRAEGSRQADQGDIWEAIADKSARMEAPSHTSAMADIFERHATAVDEYVRELEPVEGQVGAVIAVNGQVRGLELFDSPATLGKLWPKIVRSYALDAVEAECLDSEPPARASVTRLLKRIAALKTETFPAVGLGTDVRVETRSLAGGALVVDERVVHLAVFALSARGPRGRRPWRFTYLSE